MRQSNQGGSGAFLCRASDGRRYWVKPLNNLQNPRSCVTEQIVGRVGALIGAPISAVTTIEIGPAFAGWKFRGDAQLEPGVAHACRHLENALETGVLERGDRDDNAKRHAHLIALYDLCWGDDQQWLMDLSNDFSFTSHDHGMYFPDCADWTAQSLTRNVHAPRLLSSDAGPVHAGSIAAVCAALEALAVDDLLRVLAEIPATWPVSDDELETVGYFLLTRAPLVAGRLRARFLGPA